MGYPKSSFKYGNFNPHVWFFMSIFSFQNVKLYFIDTVRILEIVHFYAKLENLIINIYLNIDILSLYLTFWIMWYDR